MENRNAHKFVKALHYDEIIISNINWLKFLKDRVQPQPKQEWSEEDELKISDILALLRGGENCHYNTSELFNWLKSLRPQNRWKPSDEQMEVKKLGEIARHIIAVKQHIEDMRLSEDEWSLLEKIGYPEQFRAKQG